MILNKYKMKKKLGSGSFGQVFLVQDINKKEFAIKAILKKQFTGINQHIHKYVKDEIATLKKAKSPYSIELYQTGQDKDTLFLICEYCNGRDLDANQKEQPNKVYKLQKATQILSQVIKGLLHLHREGYVHRDIKPQNILMKKQNGNQVYKIADFGFSKNVKQITGTHLGTKPFMAPEIYTQDKEYGFEVDVWAFGVMFYFMLNDDYPFKIVSGKLSQDQIGQQMKKQALNFSYKKCVETSTKKILENCTDEVEDFFKKVFDFEQKQRINFNYITKHPLFSKYFQEKKQIQIIEEVYNGSIVIKNPSFMILKRKTRDQDQKKYQDSVIKIINQKKYDNEIQAISNLNEKIKFLMNTLEEYKKKIQLIPHHMILALEFNLTKYTIFLFNSLKRESWLRNIQQGNWGDFCKSNKFIFVQNKIAQKKKDFFSKLDGVTKKCRINDNLVKISEINQDFISSMNENVQDLKQFSGTFKKSYRQSTKAVYEHLVKNFKQTMKNKDQKTIDLNFFILLIAICHSFNKVILDHQLCKAIFFDYFMACKQPQSSGKKQSNFQTLSFQPFKKFIFCLSENQINAITHNILQIM